MQSCFPLRHEDALSTFRWKYLERKSVWVAYGAFDGGNLAAYYGNLEVPLRENGEVFGAGLCLDMAVHPDYRGRGLVTLLAEKVYASLPDTWLLSYGFSNKMGVRVDLKARGYGYTVLGEMSTFRKMVRRNISTECYSAAPARDYLLAEKQEDLGKLLVDQPAVYFDWRYRGGPLDKGVLLSVGENEAMVAQAVVRKQGKTLSLLKIIGRKGFFDEKVLPTVLGGIENYAIEERCRWVNVCVLPNGLWRKTLGRTGYWRWPIRANPYYLTVKVHRGADERLRAKALTAEEWMVMGGDIM
jgi:GNAT superfamily N-acetyltransferase